MPHSAGYRPGHPAPARPPATPWSARGCAAYTGPSGGEPARQRSPSGTPHSGRRTGGPAAGSPSPGPQPPDPADGADTGCAPAPVAHHRPGKPPAGSRCVRARQPCPTGGWRLFEFVQSRNHYLYALSNRHDCWRACQALVASSLIGYRASTDEQIRNTCAHRAPTTPPLVGRIERRHRALGANCTGHVP